jgi:hypothetical protein
MPVIFVCIKIMFLTERVKANLSRYHRLIKIMLAFC